MPRCCYISPPVLLKRLYITSPWPDYVYIIIYIYSAPVLLYKHPGAAKKALYNISLACLCIHNHISIYIYIYSAPVLLYKHPGAAKKALYNHPLA